MGKGLDFLRIIVIGFALGSGANLVAANPPSAMEDWALWTLGHAVIVLAVVMLVKLARGGRK